MDKPLFTILVSKQARKDLHNISKNLSRISKNYYLKFFKKFLTAISLIQIFPKMYPLFDKQYLYRKFTIDEYIIIYTIYEDIILIIRIFSRFENYLYKL